MIFRIICFSLFGCLIIAFLLSFAGIQEVYIGNGFRSWLVHVNEVYSSWDFKIPNVPDIPLLQTTKDLAKNDFSYKWDFDGNGQMSLGEFFKALGSGVFKVKDGFKAVLNAIITFFNFLIKLVNLVIIVLNIIIQVIQFVLSMVWSIKDLPFYLSGDSWNRWNDDESIWWYQDIEDMIEAIKNGEFLV